MSNRCLPNQPINSSVVTTQPRLAQLIAQFTKGTQRFDTSIKGLSLHHWASPTCPANYMMAPSICLIGQGRKRLVLGEEIYEYGANDFLITSVDLPVTTQIIEATEGKPYLGLTMELDLQVIAQLMLQQKLGPERQRTNRIGVAVSSLPANLLNAFERLLDLLCKPDDIAILAPLIQQEISYRLLSGEQGARIREIATRENHGYQVSRAIDWLKTNFNKPVRIEELAEKAGLSSSAFHNHFRSITAMSPIQFQKRIRLNEARRLMLTERLDASSAAFEVGYESASQFSREYSRHFGTPPARDIKNLSRTAQS